MIQKLLFVILILSLCYISVSIDDYYKDLIELNRGLKKLCNNNSHVDSGSWELIFNDIYNLNKTTDKTFVCCGSGIDTTYYKDDYLDVKEGYCLPNSTVTHNPFLLEQGHTLFNAQCGDDCCLCDREKNTRYNVTDRESYQWIPDQCYLIPWNSELFCKLLGHRKILFVGDSTQQQTATTLMSMITGGKSTCATQITYGWSTNLVYSRFKNNLIDFIERTDADIVIFTSGAHLKDMGDIWGIFMALEVDFKILREQKKNQKYIWKTQNPGHLSCNLFDKPLKWNEHSPYENDTDEYNWKIFKEFDNVARHYSKLLNFSILDMSPLYLRPDGHVYGERQDCLHYCHPGPINLFSQLLLQMLYNNEI